MKVGFVIPWFAMDIPGGAEAELRSLALNLQKSGLDLEILCTTVEKFGSDWNKNYYPPGFCVEGGLPIRRFPVRKRNTKAFDQVNARLMQGLSVTEKEESVFLEESVNSTALYRYMRSHGSAYDLFAFIPYMFGTTYYGMQIYPEKSVLIPCLHEEIYAHLSLLKEVFQKAAGRCFLSEPEADLAKNLYDLSHVDARVLGAGVDPIEKSDPEAFRDRYQIHQPFILYAGRKDAGKNVDVLIRYFSEYKRRHPSPLSLVLIGGGSIDIPGDMKENGSIMDLGFIPIEDKQNAYGAALLLCQPSSHESFSIVIMESWLSGRPVLVSGACAVTKDFAKKAQGGLYYDDYHEFEGCLNYIQSHPDLSNQMGQNGKVYVEKHFSWPIITRNYIQYFEELIQK